MCVHYEHFGRCIHLDVARIASLGETVRIHIAAQRTAPAEQRRSTFASHCWELDPPSPLTLISECIAPKTSPPLLPLLLLLPPALLLLASYLRSSPCVAAAHPPVSSLSSQYINISTRRLLRMVVGLGCPRWPRPAYVVQLIRRKPFGSRGGRLTPPELKCEAGREGEIQMGGGDRSEESLR